MTAPRHVCDVRARWRLNDDCAACEAEEAREERVRANAEADACGCDGTPHCASECSPEEFVAERMPLSRRVVATFPRSPEGPDEDLREGALRKIGQHLTNGACDGGASGDCGHCDCLGQVPRLAADIYRDAALPLLTAERERADALQRQVDAVRALCDEQARNLPPHGYNLRHTDVRAALSRTATERLPHADVPGLTPETCPQRDNHGSPFRYCPVKGCGWHEGMQR